MKKPLLFFVCTTLSVLLYAQTTNKLPGSNCNNIVHNILPADAPNRSPSDCEAQFDWKVRTALQKAFSKTWQHFPGAEWIISDTAVNQLTQISKGTEQNFFSLSYYFKVDMNPQSPAYKEWYEKYMAAMQHLKSADQNAYKDFTDLSYQMNNAIHIGFFVVVNGVSQSINFQKGDHQTFTVPGAAFAVKGPHAPALSRADDVDACLILFGTQKPSVKKAVESGTSIYQQNSFPKNTSHLTVQNISVRIECNNELLNKIVQDTDWKMIAGLIGK